MFDADSPAEARPASTIETISLAGLSPEARAGRLAACARAERPLLLVGGAAGLDAVGRWTPAYLRARAGGVPVGVRAVADVPGPGVRRAPLAELLDALERGGPAGWSFAGDDDMLFDQRGRVNEGLQGALGADWEAPAWLPRGRLLSVGLWFARGLAWGPLHYDENGAACASAQIDGRRRVRLYAPAEGPKLYPHLATALEPSHRSRVDPNRPDLERFPRFAEAAYVEAELAPGDLLVTPPLWFKSNRADEPFGIHLNFWWAAPAIPLDVTSFRWALARELARALAEGAGALSPGELLERARALGPETLGFLARLERSILADFGGEAGRAAGERAPAPGAAPGRRFANESREEEA